MSDLLNSILYLFDHTFIKQALIAGSFISVSAALIGCLIILRRWSIIGMAVSNSIIPGVILSASFHIPIQIGASISGVLCSYASNFIEKNSRIKSDSAIGLTYSAFFAFGVILISFVHTDKHIDLFHLIFGNILGILKHDMIQIITVCSIVIVIVISNIKLYTLYVFDKVQCITLGLRYKLIDTIFLVLICLTVVSSMQAVGILLTVSMLIATPMAGKLLFKRLWKIMIFSCVTSLFSVFAGIIISYKIDGSSGATIVFIQTLIYITSFAIFMVKRYLNNVIAHRVLNNT